MRNFIEVSCVIALLFFPSGFGPVRPEVPDNLKAPANEEVILVGHATGVQIYVCQAGERSKSCLGAESSGSGVNRRKRQEDCAPFRRTFLEAH